MLSRCSFTAHRMRFLELQNWRSLFDLSLNRIRSKSVALTESGVAEKFSRYQENNSYTANVLIEWQPIVKTLFWQNISKYKIHHHIYIFSHYILRKYLKLEQRTCFVLYMEMEITLSNSMDEIGTILSLMIQKEYIGGNHNCYLKNWIRAPTNNESCGETIGPRKSSKFRMLLIKIWSESTFAKKLDGYGKKLFFTCLKSIEVLT